MSGPVQDIEKQPSATISRPFKSYKIISNPVFGFIIRAAQWFVTIVVIGLAGESLNMYAISSGSMGFTMFSAVFTLLYLIVFTALTFLYPSILIIGVNLILELLITIYWFVSFIAIAAIYGPGDCDSYFYYGWYDYSGYRNSCNTSKAAIAFAAVNFALFLVSLVSLALTSVANLPNSQLFQTVSVNNATLNKPLLAVSSVDFASTQAATTTDTNSPAADELKSNIEPQGEDNLTQPEPTVDENVVDQASTKAATTAS